MRTATEYLYKKVTRYIPKMFRLFLVGLLAAAGVRAVATVAMVLKPVHVMRMSWPSVRRLCHFILKRADEH